MAKYIVEFKQAAGSDFVHTKKTLDSVELARGAAEGSMSGGDFEYLIVRKVKVGDVVTVKSKEAK
jgi:hypothetical protein